MKFFLFVSFRVFSLFKKNFSDIVFYWELHPNDYIMYFFPLQPTDKEAVSQHDQYNHDSSAMSRRFFR